jgi:Amt family ammonium transporter
MKYVDDSLDVFVCHGVGGTLGAFLLGWFASKDANPAGADGVLFGGGELLGWQVH